MQKEDALVVIEVGVGREQSRRLADLLHARRPTVWVGSGSPMLPFWEEMGTAGRARLWLQIRPGDEGDRQLIAAPYVSGLVCHHAHLEDLRKTLPPKGGRPPLFATATHLVWSRFAGRCSRQGRLLPDDRLPLFEMREVDGGVVVLSEDLPISRGGLQWGEKKVAVIADAFSGDLRPDSTGTATTSLLNGYMSLGADHVVITEESLLRRSDPLTAYDHLCKALVSQPQAKVA